MATYHVQLKNGTKGSACKYANYIAREGTFGTGKRKEELQYKEACNFPIWAESPAYFFKAADKYERVRGRPYSYFEISLPNELPLERNIKIIKDFIRTEIGDDKIVMFAIHNKQASMGGVPNPHAHIMFNTRIITDPPESVKPPELFFRKYDPRYPSVTGYRKDDRYSKRNSDLKKARARVAELINQAYEEEGLPFRVSHKTLKKQREDAIAAGDLILAEFLNRESPLFISMKESYATKTMLHEIQNAFDKNTGELAISSEDARKIKTVSDRAYIRILQKMIRQQKRMQMEEAYRKQAEEIRSAKERAEIEKRLREEEERLKKIPVTPEEIQAMLSDIGNAIIAQSRSNDRRIALYNTIYTDKTVRTQIALSVATKGKSKKFRKHLMKIQAAQKEVKRLKQTGGDKSRIADLEGQIKKATDQAKDMHEYLNYHTDKNLAKKIYDRINMMQPKRRAKAMEIQNQNEEYEKLNAKVIYIMMQLKKNKVYNISRGEMMALRQLADVLDPGRRKELRIEPLKFELLKTKTETLLSNLQDKIQKGNRSKSVPKNNEIPKDFSR